MKDAVELFDSDFGVIHHAVQVQRGNAEKLIILFTGMLISPAAFPQALDFTAVQASVDFSRTMQDWDGFGFNYV